MNLDFASFWRRFSSDWFAYLLRVETELTDPAVEAAAVLLPLVAAPALGAVDFKLFDALPTDGVPSEPEPPVFLFFLPKRDIRDRNKLDFEVFDVIEAVSSLESSDMISDALSSLL